MKSIAIFALLFVSAHRAIAEHIDSQPSHSDHPVNVVANQPAVVVDHAVGSPVGPQVGSPVGVVESDVGVTGGHHHQSGPVVGHYASSGVVPASGEQYGQPEPASMPANYKPWGSWGLYVGGNPADGYYTNYYKQLSNTVEKAGADAKPAAVSSLSPMLKQAVVPSQVGGASPFVGADYYPFAYSSSEFNSVPRTPVVAPHYYSSGVDSVPSHVSSYSSGAIVSPVHVGAQVYGTPSSFEASPLAYADSYGTKRVGGVKEPFAQRQQVAIRDRPAPKGYQQPQQQQQRTYAPVPSSYSSVAGASVPVASGPQVVAYPVPVGSQIVGSQPGVDGAFSPYGVHAFTRYAVKPAVVSSAEQAYYYYGSPAAPSPSVNNQNPQVYKSHQYSGSVAHHQPFYFYGYPINQLHYGQPPAVDQHHDQHAPVVHHHDQPAGVVHHHHHAGGVSSSVVAQPAPVVSEVVHQEVPQAQAPPAASVVPAAAPVDESATTSESKPQQVTSETKQQQQQ